MACVVRQQANTRVIVDPDLYRHIGYNDLNYAILQLSQIMVPFMRDTDTCKVNSIRPDDTSKCVSELGHRRFR